MRKVAAVLLMVAFVNTHAYGGIVSFDPSKREVDPSTGGTTATFDVSVATNGGAGFNSADLLIGSNDLALMSFDYTQEALDAFGFFITNPPAPNTSFYADGFSIGGFAPGGLASGIILGTLTVDAAGLAAGEYTVMVDSSIDGGFSNLDASESISGFGTVSVVPEPATITLLALAALGFLRRRKTA